MVVLGGRESGRGNGVSGYVIEVPSLLNEVRAVRTPAWDCGRLVVEMLYHYASQGDVQMAVTCIIVLGDRLKVCVGMAGEESDLTHSIIILSKSSNTFLLPARTS